MKFAVVGLGQAGGRIADLFVHYDLLHEKAHGRNIPVCLAINTSQSDLRGLKAIPPRDRILIGQSYSKAHGAGANIDAGAEIAKKELSYIKKALGERGAFNTENIDAFFLIAGLGGGTGSGGTPILAKELKMYNMPVIALGILPSNDEGGLMAINASRSLMSLHETVDALILFDNNRWKTPGLPIHESYSHMNHMIVRIFPLVLGAGEVKTPAMVGSKVVDASDILNSLKGFTVFGYSEASARRGFLAFKKKGKFDQLNPKDKCRSVLQDAVTRLSTDCVLGSAEKALLMLAGPPSELSKDGFDEAVRWYEANLKGAEVRGGDFPLPKSDKVMGIVFLSGIYDIPRIRELMDAGIRHRKTLDEKKRVHPLLHYKLKYGEHLRTVEFQPSIAEETPISGCPTCGSGDLMVLKSWEVKPKTKKGPAMRVTIYSCESGHRFRKTTKTEA
ncbi:tubulin/FtsZ family protein [Candidatus Hecatella orcuttiae]|uniref:tubulin/FtsZ family protein n=1 Tax=Candidatus Hecatella orcuttiae TaxID=1935119 RepID=UPI00286820A1|nr:tubulin/FtsZ family protein [Candidatus Hecatella orcuttiae]